MATKRKTKTKRAAPTAAKPRKARKRKTAKPRKRATASSGGSSKRGSRRPLQLVLRIEDTPINSPSLARLNDSQRVDLAAMSSRRTFSTRPAWAVDDAAWRRAIRTVTPHWARLRNPWPTVAWVYLHSGGTVATDGRRGLTERDRERDEQPPRRRPAGRARPESSQRAHYGDPELDDVEPVRVERVRVDETGIDDNGQYRGRGTWWRVWNSSLDSVVRAASAVAARAIVTGRAH
ncbi:MAG TPA: hypothetical protein VFN67_36305 [Polyangiales bacterium]|nr:hypothetical protein [Polyangiales bacterium]